MTLHALRYVNEPNSSAPVQIGRVAKIDANPLQSKHLETATVPVLGFSVDFVQLRGGEVYDEGSRIPNAIVRQILALIYLEIR